MWQGWYLNSPTLDLTALWVRVLHLINKLDHVEGTSEMCQIQDNNDNC